MQDGMNMNPQPKSREAQINDTHENGNRHERRKIESKKRKTKKLVRTLLRGGVGNEYSVKPQTIIKTDKKFK